MRVYVAVVNTIRGLAQERAVRLGHTLGKWEKDGHQSTFAFCSSCGLAAVATTHPEEDGPIYGSATSVTCQGEGTAPAWGRVRAWYALALSVVSAVILAAIELADPISDLIDSLT